MTAIQTQQLLPLSISTIENNMVLTNNATGQNTDATDDTRIEYKKSEYVYPKNPDYVFFGLAYPGTWKKTYIRNNGGQRKRSIHNTEDKPVIREGKHERNATL